MRARYSIFPRVGYVLETLSGAVKYCHLEELMLQQHQDARVLRHYHTLSDYSLATLHLSIAEVQQFALLACQSPQARAGKRAIVISGGRNFAFADVFRSCIEQTNIISQCFSHRDAALSWLTAPVPAVAGHNSVAGNPRIIPALLNDQRRQPIVDAITVCSDWTDSKEIP